MWSNGHKCRVIALPRGQSRGYFELLDIRYSDMNAVTHRVQSCLCNSSFVAKLQTAVQQLYLNSTPAKCLEHVIVF